MAARGKQHEGIRHSRLQGTDTKRAEEENRNGFFTWDGWNNNTAICYQEFSRGAVEGDINRIEGQNIRIDQDDRRDTEVLKLLRGENET